MERLEFGSNNYKAIEAAIHMNRYMLARDICEGKRVLDVACGEGYGSYLLSEWGAKSVIGVDVSEEAIEKAKNRFKLDNVDFSVSDAENMDILKTSSFDLIVSLETIEHVKNPEKFLKEISRVAKKDATIIISCPNDYFYYPEEKEGNKYHLKKYTFNEFKTLTESILGKNAEYLLGTYAEGYINTNKFSKPEDVKQEYMLDYKEIDAIEVPSDTNVEDNNCCYYVGIWNGQANTSSVVYSNMSNDMIKIKDAYLREIENLNTYSKNLEKELDSYKAKIDILKKEKDDCEEKLRKKEMILEITEKENEVIKSNIRDLYTSYNEIYTKLNSILFSRTYKISEKTRLFIRKFIRKK